MFVAVAGPRSKFENAIHLYMRTAFDLSETTPYIRQRQLLDTNLCLALQETTLE